MKITTQDFLLTKKASLVYRAFNNKFRQEILKFIADKERDVTSIYVHFRCDQSVASQHLAILRKVGLVTTSRDGKYIRYKVNEKKVEELFSISNTLTKQNL